MSSIAIADSAVSETDRQLIRSLARSLSPEQALWVSGYFAGAAEARSELVELSREASTVSSRASAVQPPAALLKILYASESGNAAALARQIESKAQGLGLRVGVEDLARYKTRGLAEEQTVLFVASTHGEGEPPETAASFFEFLAGRKAPALPGMRFAVLALGDSTYEFFCEAGRQLDRRLAELGATRLADRCDCDVDYEADAAAWTERLLASLQADGVGHAGPAGGAAPGGPLPAGVSGLSGGSAVSGRPAYDKSRPFPAPLAASLRLTGRGSTKETRHLEFDLAGSGLDYLPGDALGVVARNDPALVSEIVEYFGWSGSEPVAGRSGETTIAQALVGEFEITALTPRFIERWAQLSGDTALAELVSKQPRSELASFMAGNQIVDLVRKRPAPGIVPQEFVASLRGLQPRLYSIASSAQFADDEVHLCVAPLKFHLHDRERHGVASRYLAEDLQPGDTVPVYVQRNDNFRLPEDPATPIVMIGAGTGVAPYRAFMQHREALGIEGRSWLFFGERNFRSDFLYQTEWQAWHRAKALTRIDLAFSRDQQHKVYVQDRLRERATELFAWLDDGAHVYVCGDAEQMARDVHTALLSIVSGGLGCDDEAAEAWLRELQAEGRYQRDVY
ncbi:MAG TPA: assimilatory sulfite reductase (NADPH) flavoprotein subunit [Burkholderiaceae bacterium]|mgnify:CR=1 FL=1|nr:assimilatory sulfite reductase (NADPH) flavoprotein subunit [Burkholderiaceae bacterium]